MSLCALALGTTGCGCTLGLATDVDPQTTTLRVGESFTPNPTVGGACGNVAVSWSWTTTDSNVLRVEPLIGRSTGLAPGNANLIGQGTTPPYDFVTVTVTVTVVS